MNSNRFVKGVVRVGDKTYVKIGVRSPLTGEMLITDERTDPDDLLAQHIRAERAK